MVRLIIQELRSHAPFTAVGAISGIVLILIIAFSNSLSAVSDVSETVFYVLHPLHVVLSAVATTAVFRKYSHAPIWAAVLVGFFGSIGIATLSDSVIPFLGESLLDLPHREAHIGFIEMWWLVNPAAIAGIAIGLWRPVTKYPHAGHVLLSTWASLFHIIMAIGDTVVWSQFVVVFLFLFLSVWIPCCLSDIVFPLLFTREEIHSHDHGA